MCNKDDRAVLDKFSLEAFLDNPARGMDIKSSEYVGKKKDLSGGIESSGQSKASLETISC